MGFFATIGSVLSKISGGVLSIFQTSSELLSKTDITSHLSSIEKTLNKNVQGSQNNNYQLDNKINDIVTNNEKTTALLVSRIEFSRLQIKAQLIERAISNIQIHASSLNTHFQSISNIHLLMKDVTKINNTIYEMASLFNDALKSIEVDGKKAKVREIRYSKDSPQVKLSAISEAFIAYNRTKQLIADETVAVQLLCEEHLNDIEEFKRALPVSLNETGRSALLGIINSRIIPMVKNAHSASINLESELDNLPKLKSNKNGKSICELKDGEIYVDCE